MLMKKIKLVALSATLLMSVSTFSSVNTVFAASTNNKNQTTQVGKSSIPTKYLNEMLTGLKSRSTTLNIFIEPDNPIGIQQDIKWAVNDWSKSTDKVKFKIVNDRNIANVRFTTGQISQLRVAMTFKDLSTTGNQTYIDRATIKIDPANFDKTKISNAGIRVAEHELGHAMGLADIHDTNLKYSTIMWYLDPNTGITQYDRDAINYLYR